MKTKLIVPNKAVFPSHGDLYLRCGNCGSQQFKVHVQPMGRESARLSFVECAKCLRTRPIDEEGFIEAAGKTYIPQRTPKPS